MNDSFVGWNYMDSKCESYKIIIIAINITSGAYINVYFIFKLCEWFLATNGVKFIPKNETIIAFYYNWTIQYLLDVTININDSIVWWNFMDSMCEIHKVIIKINIMFGAYANVNFLFNLCEWVLTTKGVDLIPRNEPTNACFLN